MPSFFNKPPQTAAAAFLSGFKYLNDKGERNSMPGYNIISHNEKLAKLIQVDANQILQVAENLKQSNDILTFLSEIDDIIIDVQTHRIKFGKPILANKTRFTVEEGFEEIDPILTADIYRKPYQNKRFEKYLTAGLNNLKKFIVQTEGNDSILVYKCEQCIKRIENYKPQTECVVPNYSFYKKDNVDKVTSEVSESIAVVLPTPFL